MGIGTIRWPGYKIVPEDEIRNIQEFAALGFIVMAEK